jgi:radical SAM protein with 4Fe4S-binding SPASM domain
MIRYTDLKMTARQDLMQVLPLSKPFTVLIEPSSLCNFRCVQCFQGMPPSSAFMRARGTMPMALFREAVRQLRAWPGPKLKVLKLSLYGEPLVNRDFTDMVKTARQADVAERIETTTNAALLSRTVAERLVEDQLDYMRVSIYASNQSRQEAVTRSRVTLQAIRENLQVLREVKERAGSPRPFVSCKMLDSYGDDNEEFMSVFRDVADEVYIDKPHSWIKVDGADFIRGYYADRADEVMTDLRQHSTPRVACPMGFTTLAVRSDGAVAPCCVDFIGGTTLGSIADGGLRATWDSEGRYEFLKMQLEGRKHENPSCAQCDVFMSDHYTLDTIDGFPVSRLRPSE